MIQNRVQKSTISAQQLSAWSWIAPILYMLIAGLYMVVRYHGNWIETDSATFTNVIRALVQEGRLIPEKGEVYPNGYAYQAISAFIITLAGVDAVTLQSLIYPFSAALVVLPAWLLYRELTGSARSASVATLLLFTQPEFLFVILRSSHEKFTRVLLLLSLYWLVRSLRLLNRPWVFTVHVGLFYLTTFTLITSNNLFAHSFIFSVITSLALGWILNKRKIGIRSSDLMLQRLLYVSIICVGLVYLFTFYFYSPAEHDLLILRDVWDRIGALFLDVQTKRTNVYAGVAAGWISLPIYFLVSIADWFVLIGSFIIWFIQGYTWVWRRETPRTQSAWILWLFYTAFMFQGGLSIVADASGALSGNLQHRIFPSFAIFATALLGSGLANWQPKRFPIVAKTAVIVFLAIVSVLSVFKATNEPLLSNKWTFYTQNEISSLHWIDQHLKNARIWTEFDERLAVTYYHLQGDSPNGNNYSGLSESVNTRNMLLTKVTKMRSVRLQRPVPIPPDALEIYDNGEAELYHLRPLTPYQK